MCNLYSHTKGQQAIIEATRAMIDRTGNLSPQPSIFPGYTAPIVRNTAGGRELAMARWGIVPFVIDEPRRELLPPSF